MVATDPLALALRRRQDRLAKAEKRAKMDDEDCAAENEKRRLYYSVRGKKYRHARQQRSIEIYNEADPANEDPEQMAHAQAILAGAARRSQEYRARLQVKLNSKDAAERVIAEQKLGLDRKRSKTPLPKRRAELPAGGAASLHPLLTSLPPPTTSPSITAMEKSLLLEDACICTRMYARVVSEALIASSTPAELSGEDFDTLLRRERELSRAYRGPPSIFTAAALAILAGRYATDVASDEQSA
jgi:hypothetical protein